MISKEQQLEAIEALENKITEFHEKLSQEKLAFYKDHLGLEIGCIVTDCHGSEYKLTDISMTMQNDGWPLHLRGVKQKLNGDWSKKEQRIYGKWKVKE